MKPLKIIFMGSPDFAVPSLEALEESSHEIICIVTRPDNPGGRGYRKIATPVKQWAKSREYLVYQPQRLTDESFYKQLRVFNPDLIINVAFGRIIPHKILEVPIYGSINLHPSLLPVYRGGAPVQRAIFNGDKITGVSIIYMAEEIDAGDIILQKEEPIELSDTTGTLMKRLAVKGAELLLKAIELVAAGNVKRISQKNEGVVYASVLTSDEELINWGKTSLEIHNKVRGLSPSPGAYTILKGSRLKIWVTELLKNQKEEMNNTLPGMIISLDSDGFKVKTGDGFISVKEVQPEGKKRLQAGDYWRGYRLKEGTLLGK